MKQKLSKDSEHIKRRQKSRERKQHNVGIKDGRSNGRYGQKGIRKEMELEKVKTDGKGRCKRRDRQRKNPRSIDEAGSMKTRHEIAEASNTSIIELQGLHPPKNSVSDQ